MKKILIGLFILVFLVIVVGCTTVDKGEITPEESVSEEEIIEEATEQTEEVVEEQEELEDTYSSEQTTEPSQKTSTAVTEAEVATEVKPVQKEVTQAQMDALDNALLTTTIAVRPTIMSQSDRITVGETYTFGVAFKNTAQQERSFYLEPKLVQALTMSMGRLGADDTTLTWFDQHNNLDKVYTLQKGETKYVPLIIKAGPVINEKGDKTFAGTYEFRVSLVGTDEGFKYELSRADFIVGIK